MKKYKSKIGWELVAPLGLILTSALILMVYQQILPGVILILLVMAFIIHMFLTTYYIVDSENLLIKCGFLFNQKISIDAISKISETKNPLSSPATSLDRLQIKYNKYGVVLISPAEKTNFIEALLAVNPHIEVQLKSK